MKLPRPFYRLPVRFNVNRLRAEVEALPAKAWSRHPQEHEGNTAARLISVGGGDNDAVGGEMKPTPALAACPYLQQVLASFGTVWSRSRLMRIAGGASVPRHSDMNLHWFHRVRVHIPVVTRPEVRFHCGDESVHMSAGEAWVFDNWRPHEVRNPTPDARIHLVADTAGTASFWRLVAQGQSENFTQPQPGVRLLDFDPLARANLLVERFNMAAVMPPEAVEQLTLDLLGDLAATDARPESAAAVEHLIEVMVDFCRDWRSLWSLFADTAEGRSGFQSLLASTRQQVAELPPVRVASTGYSAQAVLHARLFAHALSGGARGETAEFNAATTPQAGSQAVRRPTAARAAAAGTLPRIERPLIILSAPRAGSTLLFETLAQSAGFCTIGGESHGVIESIDALRPGRGRVRSNRLTREDATAPIVAELRRRFASRLRDRDGAQPVPGAAVRLLEKTPKNALRVPFLLEIFPDAQFVFLKREPRANLSSMMEAWRANGWVTYRHLPDWKGPWSLLLPPGYESLRDRPLEDIVAYQWRVANQTILDDLAALPRDRWCQLRYEDLVRNPRTQITTLIDFAGLELDQRLSDHLAKPLPPSRHTHTAPDPEKWRRNAAEIERVLPTLAEVCARLAP